MKLRKLTLLSILFLVIITACKKDDDDIYVAPERDRQEVYDEDLIEIEAFLSTHFYNYDAFDFNDPYSEANDNFEIVFDTIAGDNSDKTPLSEMVDYKMVEGEDGLEYKLYFLTVREGLGDVLYPSDKAFLNYTGSILETGETFDSAVNPVVLNLTTVTSSQTGVIQGFREGLIEFKSATDYVNNGDGTFSYHNHGIGAIFIPSGIGYFSTSLTSVPAYSPLIFRISLMRSIRTDYELDNIFSFLEDVDGDGDVFSDDTDDDGLANFIDTDDDGDGTLTKDEIDYGEYVIPVGDPDPEFMENEYEVSREQTDNIITISTIILTDTDGDGTPDYLDSSIN